LSKNPDENLTEETPPEEFICPVDGCIASFSKKSSLKGHMLKVHKIKPNFKKDAVLETRSLAKDFKEDRIETSEAVKLARAKNQLRTLDPNAYAQLYGQEKGEKSPTSMLLDLEVMKTLRAMRGANNGGAASGGDEELRTEVRDLKQQLQDQKYATLTDSIKELREEIRASKSQGTSDLAVVVQSVEKTATKFLEKANMIDVGMALMGYDRVPVNAVTPSAAKAPPGARTGIIQGLREKGLVTMIREGRG